LNPVNDDFHGQFIRVDNWSMRTCQSCHGIDYKGGESESSCYTCHTGQAGPEECNVCHGNPNNAAPPEDLSGNTETTVITVGAHQLHMNFLNDCTNCHMQPKALSDPGHIDQTPLAEVTKWEWDRTSATCNTFCHGDTTKAYIWNDFDN
jgi:hypothetical protein